MLYCENMHVMLAFLVTHTWQEKVSMEAVCEYAKTMRYATVTANKFSASCWKLLWPTVGFVRVTSHIFHDFSNETCMKLGLFP
jgi:hypothetical protein